MTSYIFLFLILIGMVTASCDQVEDSPTKEGRELWAEQRIRDYSFVLSRYCFCAFGGPYQLEVRADTIVSIRSQVSGETVPASEHRYFETINDLFDVIDTARAQDVDKIEYEFHKTLGYPIRIDIDYLEQAVDDEVSYQIDSLNVL